jgi:hypothetical protein
MLDEDNNSLALIEDAFSKQKAYHTKWQTYENLYEAKYELDREDKLKKYNRSKLFIPETKTLVNIIKSVFTTSFFSQGCPIEISKIGDSDETKANAMNTVIEYYWRNNTPLVEMKKAFYSALVFGMGCLLCYWHKDKIVTKNIFIKDIAFDPEATAIDDIEYLCYTMYETGRSISQKIENGFYTIVKDDFFETTDYSIYKSKRYEVKEIFEKNSEDKWLCKTFSNGKLLRKVEFEYMPYIYGFAIEQNFCINDTKRKEQIMAYGDSFVNLIKELQEEINIKRNQKNDILEEIINPSMLVSDGSGINPNDLKKGAGKKIKVTGSMSGIQVLPAPNDNSLNIDLEILRRDLENASGVNNVMMGNTSPSDRRSATALSVVNANSSPRIEDMIMTINETLFTKWAELFVRLVYKNVPDHIVMTLTESGNMIEPYGNRQNIEFDLNINFGSTVNKEAKASDLLQVIQILGQNPNTRPEAIEGLLKELLVYKLGKNTRVEKIFATQTTETQKPPDVSLEDMKNAALVERGII